MPTVETPPVSKSGITTSATGERHIPASTRADGSVRKERRVRPGYRPPEDVELYKNRATEAWKNKGKGGVPGADGLKDEGDTATGTAAANKNAKRREARKKAAAAAVEGEGSQKPKEADHIEAEDIKAKEPVEPLQPADADAEKVKEAKKLAKKLRQARDLKDKKEKGDVLLPEQFEKVIKINELIRQLEGLGFDSNGEKKPET
jgi:partner of Y14 and mago protein